MANREKKGQNHMKDPVKLTHSHVEIQNMLDELESVHFPSQKFQDMVDQFKKANQKRNETSAEMDLGKRERHYDDLADLYDELFLTAGVYLNTKEGKENSFTPEEEKRYRTAKAIRTYAKEMFDSCKYYRHELHGAEQLGFYNKKLEQSAANLKMDKRMLDNTVDLCKLAFKLKTIKENTDRYTLSNALEGISYYDRETGFTAIIPDRCNPEKPETLAGISSGMKRLLDDVELKNDPDSAQWIAEKVGPTAKLFDDLDNISDHFQSAYTGITGKSTRKNEYATEQGHLYFKAVKDRYYDHDEDLRECLIGKISLHNQLVEKVGGPVGGLPKIEVNKDSETFYQDLQNAVSQKDGETFKTNKKGERVYLPGAKKIGELAERMLRFRAAVDEAAPKKAQELAAGDMIQKSREDQFVKPYVIETVGYMKKNPIGKQNAAELDDCLKQIDQSLNGMTDTLKYCEKGSPIYVYARERAIEPLKSYLSAATERYNELHPKQKVNLPGTNVDTKLFFQMLKKNAADRKIDNSFQSIASKVLDVVDVPLNEQGKKYEARVKQQKAYKKLAARFKNEVDKSTFPSPKYKVMAEQFKKAMSVEAEPDPVKRENVYQELYNAASEYLLYKDPQLDGKAKKLSAYEEKRVKFAEDLREFCKRGGAKPENYDLKKEQRITGRQPRQPAKGGIGLG